MNNLVLSLFPGIGLLDMAFEGEGFCVVRGPDLLWGGDIKRFHPPEGVFQAVIGGPPCQSFSRLRYLVEFNGYKIKENLIPEFERCIREAQPEWFLMENVRQATTPNVEGYNLDSFLLNNRSCGGEQERIRKIVFGRKGGKPANLQKYVKLVPFVTIDKAPTVCASGGTIKDGKTRQMGIKTRAVLLESLRLQGLPENFLDNAPFTLRGKHQVIGNGVPLPMGKTLAKAVKALFCCLR